ncbi:MAG: adenylyltransferase/cytidyltransferase family protein [Clostridia bacterium]|nr:adenylyltransferase/cytidyltransferase family protein [Clostridia bacterium]
MPKKKIGFTIGKYAPLHKGHQLVIETAIKEMDEVYCVIYDTDLICCDIETRAGWLKKLYPNIKIIYAFDSPKQYGLDKESVEIQMNYLSNLVKMIPVTHFYSSELYGEKVAQYLNIENRLVDLERKLIPIYANDIRFDLEKNKKYLEKFIYDDLKKDSII